MATVTNIATEQNMAKVECLIKEDPPITENEINTENEIKRTQFESFIRKLESDPSSSSGCLEALHLLGAQPAD